MPAITLTLTEVVCFVVVLIQIQNRILVSTAEVASETEINPCDEKSAVENTTCSGGGKGLITKYFYDKKRKACSEVQIPDCGGQSSDTSLGFSNLEECQTECEKTRSTRRSSSDSQYGVLADFEITAPKQLSSTSKRKFPLQLCNLQWDSGVVCPNLGLKRKNYMDQFYYDAKTNACAHFVYNGCGGNANRFFSIWECIQSCVRKYHLNSFRY